MSINHAMRYSIQHFFGSGMANWADEEASNEASGAWCGLVKNYMTSPATPDILAEMTSWSGYSAEELEEYSSTLPDSFSIYMDSCGFYYIFDASFYHNCLQDWMREEEEFFTRLEAEAEGSEQE